MKDSEIQALQVGIDAHWAYVVRHHDNVAVISLNSLFSRIGRGNSVANLGQYSQILATVLAYAKSKGYTLVSTVNHYYHGDPVTSLVFNYRKPRG